MQLDQLTTPVYTIVCPACGRDALYSLFGVVTKNFLHCTFCHERLEGTMYYRRLKVEELMKKVGYSGWRDFISPNDKQ